MLKDVHATVCAHPYCARNSRRDAIFSASPTQSSRNSQGIPEKRAQLACKVRYLAKVTEPENGVNFLVCVTKSTGTLRLCLDPKDLNQAIT